MQTKSYEFLHHGVKHKVFNHAALNLINVGVEINDDYLDGIFEFINPVTMKISDTDYLRLFFQDYYNRMIYNKKDGFGNILEYDNNCNIVETYSNLYEAVLNGNPDSFYGFDIFEKQGKRPIFEDIQFFGTKLNVCKSNTYIETLNRIAKECFNLKVSKSVKTSYDFWKNKTYKKYTLEEFRNQKIKNLAFQLGELIYNDFDYVKSRKNNERLNLDETEYNSRLNLLLNKYSIGSRSMFENVENLFDFKGWSGIYVFCLDKFRGYYVGQAKTDVSRRIKAHFNQPTSSFDNYYKAKDITKIYILKCPEAFLNRLEQDCIATISKKYSLNSSVGGNALAWLSDENYNENHYLIEKDKLIKILDVIKTDYIDYRNSFFMKSNI